jgi:Cytochrome P460
MLERITAGEVEVNPGLAMQCVGVSQSQVDAARKQVGPHAHASIVVYMNDLAATAFRSKSSSYPVGAIVVKEKLTHGYKDENRRAVPGGRHGVGGMVKRSPGYDSKHGDWEYFYFENAEAVESGRISTCVSCHQSAKARDHVFGGWVKVVANNSLQRDRER